MINLSLCGVYLQGTIAGRNLSFNFQAGASPAPGTYSVWAVNNPIFGQLAILVPIGQSGGSKSGWGSNDGGITAGRGWGSTDGGITAGRGWGSTDGGITAGRGLGNQGFGAGNSGQFSGQWCISKSILPGLNCLTMTSGFADLMAALQAEGSATLTVY